MCGANCRLRPPAPYMRKIDFPQSHSFSFLPSKVKRVPAVITRRRICHISRFRFLVFIWYRSPIAGCTFRPCRLFGLPLQGRALAFFGQREPPGPVISRSVEVPCFHISTGYQLVHSPSHLLFCQVVEKLGEVPGAPIGPMFPVMVVASGSAVRPHPERNVLKDNGGIDADLDGNRHAEMVLYARRARLY